MRIVFYQVFPLGRFHATPWRSNPFDDPYGEWPPSPWRFVRAVVARWYQWVREGISVPEPQQIDHLIRVLCACSYRFHIPEHARKGSPLRQYFPVEFGWNPKAKKAGTRGYSTSLAQDNYWCIATGDDGAVWWFLDGGEWTDTLLTTLDACLERITYFGRAETFTRIGRSSGPAPQPNCELSNRRAPGSVPVLAPSPSAARADIERVTDAPHAINRSVPLGAHIMYAIRPARPPARESPSTPPVRPDCRLLQFAIGWNVAPDRRAVVRLTGRFRGVVHRELLRIRTGDSATVWSRVDPSVREAMADMLGKDAHGKPLVGHQHTEFLVWCEEGVPTRILVWREGRPFDRDEQTAILRAASRELSWAAAGSDADEWKVKLIPLDRSVPPPPGFEGVSSRFWESVTQYVPPRHHLRQGKPRARESLVSQIRRELALRGIPGAEHVEVEEFGNATWVSVHLPRGRKEKRPFKGNRRGYSLYLTFPEPVKGPLRLGHSCSFGLGLFRPTQR